MPALSQIDLTQIYCVSTSEPGSDELFFKVAIDNLVSGQYPTDGSYHSISKDGTWPLGITYAYTDYFTISLFDNDGGSGSDPLGSYTFSAGQPVPTPVTVSDDNGAEYQISFKIDTCGS